MNAPIPHTYDAQNASTLVQLAAAAYRLDASDIISNVTDTRARLIETSGDLIVAFRGTADLRNWLTDLDWRKTALHWADGKVHGGFNKALESVAELLDHAIDPKDHRRIWVTGHSLGGALAMLFALRLRARRNRAVAGVYTFGQPRLGNLRFSLGYNDALKACTFRVVHAADVVPRIPWLLGSYRHAGHEVFYRSGFPAESRWNQPLSSESSYVLDRPLCSRLLNDARALCRELSDPQLTLLADHYISHYVNLVSCRRLQPAPPL